VGAGWHTLGDTRVLFLVLVLLLGSGRTCCSCAEDAGDAREAGAPGTGRVWGGGGGSAGQYCLWAASYRARSGAVCLCCIWLSCNCHAFLFSVLCLQGPAQLDAGDAGAARLAHCWKSSCLVCHVVSSASENLLQLGRSWTQAMQVGAVSPCCIGLSWQLSCLLSFSYHAHLCRSAGLYRLIPAALPACTVPTPKTYSL
jgi:hypothetical protein